MPSVGDEGNVCSDGHYSHRNDGTLRKCRERQDRGINAECPTQAGLSELCHVPLTGRWNTAVWSNASMLVRSITFETHKRATAMMVSCLRSAKLANRRQNNRCLSPFLFRM